jgi:hypothetical protein
MRTPVRLATLIASVTALASIGAASASAAGGDVYKGETDDGRPVKLVTGDDGAVIRGAATTMTHCGPRFDPFRARFDFHRPLDRSRRSDFRDAGSTTESDDRFSARYRYEIEGTRNGPHLLEGSFDLEVVFRKDGEKYATCRAEDVGYEARNQATG